MKMSKELLADFEALIVPVMKQIGSDIHGPEYFELSPMRYRWAHIWALGYMLRNPLFDKAYKDEGLNDEHIDTALKDIIKRNKKV